MKLVFTGLLIFFTQVIYSQNIESFGVFGGLNVPFTIDQGLQKDPRFFPKVILRATPIGFLYGYDKSGFGFAITPSFSQLGQKFTVQNNRGGEVGFRDIRMNYITVPVALKLHINDISFFRLSLIASLAPSYLFSAKEVYNIAASELKYPAGVTVPPASEGYTIAYDGVYVPNLVNKEYVSKNKFSSFQLFAGVGFRSDFDLSDNWSINFDGRVNFGIFEPRNASYIHTLKNPSAAPGSQDAFGNAGAPDLYGSRRDFFLSGQIGICRIIQTKVKYNARHSGKLVFDKKKPVARKKNIK